MQVLTSFVEYQVESIGYDFLAYQLLCLLYLQ